MPALLEMQRALRALLLDDAERTVDTNSGHAQRQDPAQWAPGPAQSANLPPWLDADPARLAIYRHTILSTLVNALRLSHPAVHRLVGAQFFDGAAHVFVSARLPQSADLNEYGAQFAGFLQQFPPAAGLIYLADVARLDWAVHRALHAHDAPPLDLGRLAALDAGDVPHLALQLQPSLMLIRVDHPADAIWRAVLAQDEAALAAIDVMAGPRWLRIGRDHTGIDVAALPAAEWDLLQRLAGGQPLHVALEASGVVDAQAVLARELASGRFTDFHLLHSPSLTAGVEVHE